MIFFQNVISHELGVITEKEVRQSKNLVLQVSNKTNAWVPSPDTLGQSPTKTRSTNCLCVYIGTSISAHRRECQLNIYLSCLKTNYNKE